MGGTPPAVEPGTSAEVIQAVVFGDLWNRTRLTRRERRMVVLTILTLIAREEVLEYHLKAAFEKGDIDEEDFQELVLTISLYGGACVGAGLLMQGSRWLERNRAQASD